MRGPCGLPAILSGKENEVRGLCTAEAPFLKLSDDNVCFVEAADGSLLLSGPAGDSVGIVGLLGATGFSASCERRCFVAIALFDAMMLTVPAAILSCWL